MANFAQPFALLPSIFDLIQLRNGFGVHIQFVTSMDKIVNYGYLLYILLLFYNLGLLFFKLSCLAFYVRVFPVIRWLRIAAWVLGGLIIAWAVANEFVLIFRCHPINLAWLGDAAMQAESCIPESTVFIAQSIPTIFFDVVILSMPIKLVWGLQMKLSQRLSVIGIFLLGFLVTLISIVRLVSTVISTDEDLTCKYSHYIQPLLERVRIADIALRWIRQSGDVVRWRTYCWPGLLLTSHIRPTAQEMVDKIGSHKSCFVGQLLQAGECLGGQEQTWIPKTAPQRPVRVTRRLCGSCWLI